MTAHVVGRIGGRTEYTVKSQIVIGNKMYNVSYIDQGLRHYDRENFIKFSVRIPKSVGYWEDSADADIQLID